MQLPLIALPCPCCGFMTLQGEYGSYAVCELCDWEDDGVQLANPTSEGGANRRSLAQAQEAFVNKYPAHVELVAGSVRSKRWRPLSTEEIANANAKKAARHWHSDAVLTESEAYWSLGI